MLLSCLLKRNLHYPSLVPVQLMYQVGSVAWSSCGTLCRKRVVNGYNAVLLLHSNLARLVLY